MNTPLKPIERIPLDPYTRELTKSLRPKYGPTFAPLLAEAFIEFTEDRPVASVEGEERTAYLAEARQRFNARVGRLKAQWASHKLERLG